MQCGHLCAVLHSSLELSVLSQWLHHDNSIIQCSCIVTIINIIITMTVQPLQLSSHNGQHGLMPTYLHDELCQPADTESRQRLRSALSTTLDVRRTRLSTQCRRQSIFCRSRSSVEQSSITCHCRPISPFSALVLITSPLTSLSFFLTLLSSVQCLCSDSSFWTL